MAIVCWHKLWPRKTRKQGKIASHALARAETVLERFSLPNINFIRFYAIHWPLLQIDSSRYLDERKTADEKSEGSSSRKRKISELSDQTDSIEDGVEVAHKKTKTFDIFSRFSSIANMATTVMSNAFGWIFRPKSVRESDLSITSQAITDRALIQSTNNTIVKKVGGDSSSSSSSSSSHSQSIESALKKSKLEKSRKLSRKSAAAEIQMTVSAVLKDTRWRWEALRTAALLLYTITVQWTIPGHQNITAQHVFHALIISCTLYAYVLCNTVDLPVSPSEARVLRGARGRIRGGLYYIQGWRPFEFSFNCYSSCCQTTEGQGGNSLIYWSTAIRKSYHYLVIIKYLLQRIPL